MSLQKHYDRLYKNAYLSIVSDNYEIDHLIESDSDNRFGITLLIRPPVAIKDDIQKFLSLLKIEDPDQYYYENSDIHITVLSIISCYDGFKLDDIDIQQYIKIVKTALKNIPPFTIHFKGITASPSCLMVQGFMSDETLNELRQRLRHLFKNSVLQESIDKRYSIQTAHTTVVRFKNRLKNKTALLNTIEKYRTHDFGTFQVKCFELVYNDWYQKTNFVKQLFKFTIDKQHGKTQ